MTTNYTPSAATAANGLQVVIDLINDPTMAVWVDALEYIATKAFPVTRSDLITRWIEDLYEIGHYVNYESVYALVEAIRAGSK
jgi:hypothetical protein